MRDRERTHKGVRSIREPQSASGIESVDAVEVICVHIYRNIDANNRKRDVHHDSC